MPLTGFEAMWLAIFRLLVRRVNHLTTLSPYWRIFFKHCSNVHLNKAMSRTCIGLVSDDGQGHFKRSNIRHYQGHSYIILVYNCWYAIDVNEFNNWANKGYYEPKFASVSTGLVIPTVYKFLSCFCCLVVSKSPVVTESLKPVTKTSTDKPQVPVTSEKAEDRSTTKGFIKYYKFYLVCFEENAELLWLLDLSCHSFSPLLKKY